MSKKRDRLQIIYDILSVIKEKNGKIKPTNVLYKSNLSNQMFVEYMNELTQKGFISENNINGGKTYSLTQKGFDYLNKYQMIVDFTSSFGLGE
ncbi:MAG TPA: winged helix-turn-helix domain-containing protein [Candidatus Nanoarchaeia archaeon]|nr:winged helix-turn-helix domain-containing protein [Candidatus Nanoarchaeia archaeon]